MLLELEQVSKTFESPQGPVRALQGASLGVEPGQCVGLIGESGSGKSTLAGIAAGLVLPDAGAVRLAGTTLDPSSRRSVRAHQRRLQMVFQEPRRSFDPRMTIGQSLAEPLRWSRRLPRAEHRAVVADALVSVGLPVETAARRIHDVSVGQAQRAAIARAVLAQPELMVCDEITSALDVTVQAEIVALLRDLCEREHLSMLFVSHDLAIVASLAHHVVVLERGVVVEQGPTEQVITDPARPYTQLLVAAARAA